LIVQPTLQPSSPALMITLYSFGPAYGLPDASPFVTKAELLLKMANLLHRTDTTGLARAPNGQLPYIDDDGVVVPDATFIRWHLEKKYRIDYDLGLTAAQRAAAWTFERMAEDQLYWVLLHDRWVIDGNFRKGPARSFNTVPSAVRPLVIAMMRRKMRAALHAQGLGRHSYEDVAALGVRSINAIADFLGDKPFFMGAEPGGIDATMFAFVCAALCPYFESRLRSTAERRDNLRGYVGRMTALYYPGLDKLAGCKAVLSTQDGLSAAKQIRRRG
jgi:glutathione S-transferase